MAGVAIGVAALILTLSIVNGFESEIRRKIISFDTHIRLRLFHGRPMQNHEDIAARLLTLPHVLSAQPYVTHEALIRYKDVVDGILLEGVAPQDTGYIRLLTRRIIEGSVTLNAPPHGDSGLPGIILGLKVASRLIVNAGDTVTLFSIEGVPGPFNQPSVKQFRVAALFQTGMLEYDNALAFTSIDAARSLFLFGNTVSGIKILLDDPEKADLVSATINQELGYPYFPLSWRYRHSNLFSWLETQRLPMVIIFGLIALVAVVNIVSTLIMIVIEKTVDIGILKSMGASTDSVMKIFVWEGFVIGLIGVLFGFILAFALGTIQQRYQLFSLPPDVYFMEALPVLMRPLYFASVGLSALFICLVATLYPARKAARLQPASAIHSE